VLGKEVDGSTLAQPELTAACSHVTVCSDSLAVHYLLALFFSMEYFPCSTGGFPGHSYDDETEDENKQLWFSFFDCTALIVTPK